MRKLLHSWTDIVRNEAYSDKVVWNYILALRELVSPNFGERCISRYFTGLIRGYGGWECTHIRDFAKLEDSESTKKNFIEFWPKLQANAPWLHYCARGLEILSNFYYEKKGDVLMWGRLKDLSRLVLRVPKEAGGEIWDSLVYCAEEVRARLEQDESETQTEWIRGKRKAAPLQS